MGQSGFSDGSMVKNLPAKAIDVGSVPGLGRSPGEDMGGVWVGGEERSIHFDRMAIGQGANMSLPIWAMFMQKVYADTTLSYNQSEKFSIPRWFKANEGCIQDDTPEGGESTAELVAEISE